MNETITMNMSKALKESFHIFSQMIHPHMLKEILKRVEMRISEAMEHIP
jgi:hypothetical protein